MYLRTCIHIMYIYICWYGCVCVRACYINVRVEPPTTLLCISLSYPICACLYWRNRPSWGQLPSTPRVLLAPKSPQVFLSPTVAAVAAAQSNLAEDLVWLQTLPKQPKIIMSIHSKEWNGVSLCNIIIHIYIISSLYYAVLQFPVAVEHLEFLVRKNEKRNRPAAQSLHLACAMAVQNSRPKFSKCCPKDGLKWSLRL